MSYLRLSTPTNKGIMDYAEALRGSPVFVKFKNDEFVSCGKLIGFSENCLGSYTIADIGGSINAGTIYIPLHELNLNPFRAFECALPVKSSSWNGEVKGIMPVISRVNTHGDNWTYLTVIDGEEVNTNMVKLDLDNLPEGVEVVND